MYMVPMLYETVDYLCPVENDELEICKSECTFRRAIACEEEVFELCTILMRERNLQVPRDAYQACDLYMELRRCLNELV